MKELSKHTRNELIQIIRVYNDKNIIKNYLNLPKKDLIKLIEKHIQFDDEGKVEAKQRPTKVVEYDEFKNKLEKNKLDKELSYKQELKLARARGRQRGKIAKIDDQLLGLREELENKPKLKNDKNFIKEVQDLAKLKEIEKSKLKTINKLFKKFEEAKAKAQKPDVKVIKAKPKAKQDDLLAEVKRFQELEAAEEDKFKKQKEQFADIEKLNKTVKLKSKAKAQKPDVKVIKAKPKAKQDDLLAEVKRFQELEAAEEDKFKKQKEQFADIEKLNKTVKLKPKPKETPKQLLQKKELIAESKEKIKLTKEQQKLYNKILKSKQDKIEYDLISKQLEKDTGTSSQSKIRKLTKQLEKLDEDSPDNEYFKLQNKINKLYKSSEEVEDDDEYENITSKIKEIRSQQTKVKKDNEIKKQKIEDEIERLIDLDEPEDESEKKRNKLEAKKEDLEEEMLDIVLSDEQLLLLIGKYKMNGLELGLINYLVKNNGSFDKIINNIKHVSFVINDLTNLTNDIDIQSLFENGIDEDLIEALKDNEDVEDAEEREMQIEELEESYKSLIEDTQKESKKGRGKNRKQTKAKTKL